MQLPSRPDLASEDAAVVDASLLEIFVTNDGVATVVSFLAANCARKEDAGAAVALDDVDSFPALFPVPNVLARFVNGEFLKIFGVEAKEEVDATVDEVADEDVVVVVAVVVVAAVVVVVVVEDDDAALLPTFFVPPFIARSRSTSDELVAAAAATVDADRPSPESEYI